MRPKDFNTLPSAKLRFIEPMYARLVNELPEGTEWLYEVKLDGYRCLEGKGKHQVTLWSRRKNLFTKRFPRIAQVCEQLNPDTLLDGEIVAWMNAGESLSISCNITASSAGVVRANLSTRSSYNATT